MNSRNPRIGAALPLLARVARHREPQGTHDGYIGRYVPLPESGACAPQCRREARLVFLERNLRSLSIVDLDADPGGTGAVTLGTTLGDPTSLQQPQPARLTHQHAIFELEFLEAAITQRIALPAKLRHIVGMNTARPAVEMID